MDGLSESLTGLLLDKLLPLKKYLVFVSCCSKSILNFQSFPINQEIMKLILTHCALQKYTLSKISHTQTCAKYEIAGFPPRTSRFPSLAKFIYIIRFIFKTPVSYSSVQFYAVKRKKITKQTEQLWNHCLLFTVSITTVLSVLVKKWRGLLKNVPLVHIWSLNLPESLLVSWLPFFSSWNRSECLDSG